MKVILIPNVREASLMPDDLVAGHDLTGLAVVDVPDDFSWAGKTIDWDALTIVTDIVGIRASRWAQVKAKREAVQNDGCDTPAGRVQTDAASRATISGAALMAYLTEVDGDFYSIDFTLADNSRVTLNGGGIIGVAKAVSAFINAVHATALTKRAAIEVAMTPEAVQSIDLDSGWPQG